MNRHLLAWPAIALLSGCSMYSPPRLQVTEVTIGDRTEHGTEVLIAVTATNPNDVPLPLREAEYSLAVAGTTVFRGTRSPEATLRRYGTQVVTFPAVVPAGAASVENGITFEVRGWVIYQTPGAFAEILFDAELRRPSAGFGADGKFGAVLPTGPATMTPISPLPERTPPPSSRPEGDGVSPSASPKPESDVRWSKPLQGGS